MLKYAAEMGWQYVAPHKALALHGGDTGLFFTEVPRDYIIFLSKDDEMTKVIPR